MHLFVSDDIDLPVLREALLELPADAYGQVFVETAFERHEELERPAGIAVTWLRRGTEVECPRPVGSHAAVAAGAWASEWMVGAATPPQRTFVWVGVSVRSSVQVLMQRDGCPCPHRHHDEHRQRPDVQQ